MLWEELVEYLAEPSTWSGSGAIGVRLWEHLWVSLVATLAAALVFLPLALWLGHIRRGANAATLVVNIGRAVPSFGILAVAFLIMVRFGAGVGSPVPVLVALVALAAPPIFTNTVTAVLSVDPATVEAAKGVGYTGREVLLRVELPMSVPVIMEGVRIAFVQVIATATLGAFVAWGGLGRLIVDGFASQDLGELTVGAVLVGMMAILAEAGLSSAQRRVTPRGMRSAA